MSWRQDVIFGRRRNRTGQWFSTTRSRTKTYGPAGPDSREATRRRAQAARLAEWLLREQMSVFHKTMEFVS